MAKRSGLTQCPGLACAAMWLIVCLMGIPSLAAALPTPEPNESFESAAPIEPGTYEGAIAHSFDLDWFVVPTAENEALIVRLLFSHVDGDLDLKLYDADGILRSSSISVDDDELVLAIAPVAMPLYIQVYGYNNARNSYVMEVERRPNGGIPADDDAFEDNDLANDATPLASGLWHDGLALLDEDWYTIEAAHEDTLTIELAFYHLLGDIDAELIDASGQVVAVGYSGDNDEVIHAPFVAAGTYLLRVYGYEEAQNSYSLSLERQAPLGPGRWSLGHGTRTVWAGGHRARRSGPTISSSSRHAWFVAPSPSPRNVPDKVDPNEALFVPGRFLVAWESPSARLPIESREQRATLPAAIQATTWRELDETWSVVASDETRSTAATDDAKMIELLRAMPGVRAVEQDRWWRVCDGPLLADWPAELDRAEVPYLDLIELQRLWSWSLGQGTIVAVIDTGVWFGHPDLQDAMWTNGPEVEGVDGVDDDRNGYIDDLAGWDFVTALPSQMAVGEDGDPADNDPNDFQGHGTAVAGTLAARIGNAIPNGATTNLVGVAPSCKIMALRAGFKTPSGQGMLATSDWLAALRYAADNGAHIVNMSFEERLPSQAVDEGIAAAREAGVMLVAAAGNNAFYAPRYPAANAGVLSVGSVRNDLVLSSFTNFGDWVRCFAPGENILVPTLDGGYTRAQGTSFSAPIVAGLLALQRSADAGASADEMEARGLLMGRSIAWQNPRMPIQQIGVGLIHAGAGATMLAEEEAGAVVRTVLRNVGGAPIALEPIHAASIPGIVAREMLGSQFPHPDGLRAIEWHIPHGQRRVSEPTLTPLRFGAASAMLQRFPDDFDLSQLGLHDGGANGFGAWNAATWTPDPLVPWIPSSVDVSDRLELEIFASNEMALAVADDRPILGTTDLQRATITFSELSLPLGAVFGIGTTREGHGGNSQILLGTDPPLEGMVSTSFLLDRDALGRIGQDFETVIATRLLGLFEGVGTPLSAKATISHIDIVDEPIPLSARWAVADRGDFADWLAYDATVNEQGHAIFPVSADNQLRAVHSPKIDVSDPRSAIRQLRVLVAAEADQSKNDWPSLHLFARTSQGDRVAERLIVSRGLNLSPVPQWVHLSWTDIGATNEPINVGFQTRGVSGSHPREVRVLRWELAVLRDDSVRFPANGLKKSVVSTTSGER